MSLDDKQIINEFVEEAREHLSDFENQLLAIEAGGENIDVQLVNTVFRGVHSIKGASGFLGLTTIADLTHYLENVLNLMRNRELIPNSAMVDVMLRAADLLREMVNDVPGSNDVDVSMHVESLKKIAAGEFNSGGPSAEQPDGTPSAHNVEESATEADHANPTADNHGDLSDMHDPNIQDTNDSSDHVTAAETTQQGPPASPPSVDPVNDESNSLDLDTASTTASTADGSIRVNVSILDHLMNLAGELVLGRNQLVQTVSTDEMIGIDSVCARVDQVTSELQEAIMQTRMQPIGNAFSKFPRLIRDLSKNLGKQCEIIIKGKEVDLDKSIIEAIGDPLTHLVRNSIDHGIETPDIRKANGKPASGKIVLQAFHQAGKVNITISDDGAGIDTTMLKQKAVAKGVISAEKAASMSQREAERLIFYPGFSTAEKVTDVSGRGVGMDVVKTNIENLGGTVDIDTQVGIGTTIHVKLPLTLAIIPSLIVRCGKGRFAIPQVNISELVRIKANEVDAKIGKIRNAEVLRLRGSLLPLVRLSEVIGVDSQFRDSISHDLTQDQRTNITDPRTGGSSSAPSGEVRRGDMAAGALNIIVVEAGQLHYGVIVDELFDSEEIVVKPLGRHMKDSPCLAGATILGDGQVALILDITGIATYTKLEVPESDETDVGDKTARHTSDESQEILLVTNDPSEYFGIPMGQTARIERIRSDQIDTVGGQQLLQYRGGSLPLLSLEDHINAKPRPDQTSLHVVVSEIEGREVGVIVPAILDIRNITTEVDTVTVREPGVIGSVVLDEMTIRIIDVYQLATKARPDWFTNTNSHSSSNGHTTRHILLAEDSGFFRQQVTNFLQTAGYEVTACEDGQIAWNTLLEVGDQIDLVVTDLEMPNLNGFDLCHRIKQDARLSHLSVIALTSLAGEADIERGMQCGVDDYHVKMDRDKLLSAVVKLSLSCSERSVTTNEHSMVGAGS